MNVYKGQRMRVEWIPLLAGEALRRLGPKCKMSSLTIIAIALTTCMVSISC